MKRLLMSPGDKGLSFSEALVFSPVFGASKKKGPIDPPEYSEDAPRILLPMTRRIPATAFGWQYDCKSYAK